MCYFTHPQLKTIKPLFQKISVQSLKKKLVKFFPDKDIIFTDLGRSAFQIAIKELGLENSEMLIPGYICDILKPIFEHYNIKPIYIDIDLKTFHMNASLIENRITPNTKSILVCHTYGLPVKMDKILEIAKKYNLKIIEDCAHLPPSGLPRGTRGDCAFFSFSKIFPSINGGMLISKNTIKPDLPKYKSKISNLIKFFRLCPFLAGFSEKFRKSYEKPVKFTSPKKASNLSLKTFNWYLNNFEKQISKRTELAKYFHKNLQKLGFQVSPGITYISALVPENINRDELFKKLRKKNIFCSRIWHKPIYLNLPNTSEAAKRIINFPLQNWFTKKDIDKIIKITSDILLEKD